MGLCGDYGTRYVNHKGRAERGKPRGKAFSGKGLHNSQKKFTKIFILGLRTYIPLRVFHIVFQHIQQYFPHFLPRRG